MLGWILLVIAAFMLALWLSVEVAEEEKKPSKQNLNTFYASEISRKKNQHKRMRGKLLKKIN